MLEHQFKQLFDSQYHRLCRAAYRIIKDEEEAREIVQNSFVQLWENRSHWKNINSLEAYLYTSVYNRSVNAYKKLRAIRNSSVGIDGIDEGQWAPVQIEVDQLERIIADAIHQLPDRCREIFLLSREEGLSYREIAAKLDISIKTVEAQMGIAFKRLKSHIEVNTSGQTKIILLFF